jgi:hypothetical protein
MRHHRWALRVQTHRQADTDARGYRGVQIQTHAEACGYRGMQIQTHAVKHRYRNMQIQRPSDTEILQIQSMGHRQ